MVASWTKTVANVQTDAMYTKPLSQSRMTADNAAFIFKRKPKLSLTQPDFILKKKSFH